MEEKIYIVIPTKNRADTLYYAIKTALNQNYDNYEIIISDNFSSKETGELIAKLNHPKIRYQRSDRPLAMLNSWEFAISAITEPGYVHVMGDDNGLLPGALQRVNDIVKKTRSQIVHSDVIDYIWPEKSTGQCSLSIPLSKDILCVDSQKSLKSAFNLKIGFSRLPTINVSFVHTAVIDRARSYGKGRYFMASNPDVYSAFINAFCVDKYIYCRRPLIMNGGSWHSNGNSAQTNQGKSPFVEDNLSDGYKYHPIFPSSTSYYLNVYEALAKMCDYTGFRNFKNEFDAGMLIKKIIDDEYIEKNRFWLKRDINYFSEKFGLNTKIPNVDKAVKEVNQHLINQAFGFVSSSIFKITDYPDAISNVYDASLISNRILNHDFKKSFGVDFVAGLKNYGLKLVMGAKSLPLSSFVSH